MKMAGLATYRLGHQKHRSMDDVRMNLEVLKYCATVLFLIFVLFRNGSTYVLCPVIPFGSVCSWASLEELHEDLNAFGLKLSNINVISSSTLALDWLESTFPELAHQNLEEHNKLVLRAHPYAPLDASFTLQIGA